MITKTITLSDRHVNATSIKISNEGDNNAERIKFVLPARLASASVFLFLSIENHSDVVLLDDERTFTPERKHTQYPGRWTAYLEAQQDGDVVWHSDPFGLIVGDLPDTGERIEQAYPTAVEQAMKAAAEAAKVTGMTARAVELPAGAEPTADYANGILTIGIPLGGDVSEDQVAQAVADYLATHPIKESDPTVPDWAKQPDKPSYTADEVGAIAQTELQASVDTALEQAKASGAFDGAPGPQGEQGPQGIQGETGPAGADGKDGAPGADGQDGTTPTIGDNGNWHIGDTDTGKPSRGEIGPAGADGKAAYAYAVEGGYTGTESEFAAKLAEEMPDKLPNPNALTLTGAVTGTYDGSAPVSVEIPGGGSAVSGGGNWRLIRAIDVVSGTSIYSFDTDNNGNAFKVKNFLILIGAYPTDGYLEIKPNGNFSFLQKPTGKHNYPFSFLMKRSINVRYIFENSTSSLSTFERTISEEYSSFGEFTSFSFWFASTPTSDATMYILGEDV